MTRPSAVDALLADPSRCRVFAEGIAIHWYPDNPAEGRCWCGKLERYVEAADE